MNSLPTNDYARQVAEAALREHPPTEIWMDNKAKLVRFGLTFLSRWVFDIAMSKMFGLYRLNAFVAEEWKNI